MRIGELSRRTGSSIRSLRYYEQCGLIAASRSDTGQRHYDDLVVDRVLLVQRLLGAGLGTSAIADVLPCMSHPESQTSNLTCRLLIERDRLAVEIARRIETKEALERLIAAAPPEN